MNLNLITAALACALSFSTSASAQSGAPTTVRSAIPPAVLSSIVPWVADGLGLWKKAGLESTYVSASGSSLLQVVASNSADLTLLDVGGAASGLANKAFDPVFVAGIYSAYPGQLLCRDGAVPAGLSGKALIQHLSKIKLGITGPGSGTDTFTRLEMHEAGVTPIPQNIITVGGTPLLIAAVEAKSVDCIWAIMPIGLLLGNKVTPAIDYIKGEGSQRLRGKYLYTGYIFDRKQAERYPEFTKKVGLVMREATRYIADPANNAALTEMLAPKFVGLSKEHLSKMLAISGPTFDWGVTEEQMKTGIDIHNTLNPTKAIQVDPASLIFDPLRADLQAEFARNERRKK